MPTLCNVQQEMICFEDSPLKEYIGYSSADIAKLSGLHDIACNFRILKQGQFSCPYHFHHNAEELFVILGGKGKLRTKEGIRDVCKGDTIFFETGMEGAHQLKNESEEDLVYLDLKTLHGFDVCEYPDTGKVNLVGKELFLKGKTTGYFDGEEHIEKIWKTVE
ncbi:cupin domain-containing protein [Sphaerochaeta pleomorpha str. Grapes]|uniref:Cupin domain-containing protein n=1 Tax=Sphaerochaeta pleomorpha (strain ATCC BAA-1885 / DSM 22778 / Grapes) TaxID=158190 RepID=G8QVJ8_SPHPG|nr:cupin domain-containing protein [Sphaerochaeta pleomorpha]AEV28231.1 cupin domain-containing protein [Sphaerochaeta pleomorpha str. Grapes]